MARAAKLLHDDPELAAFLAAGSGVSGTAKERSGSPAA
jgi:hypothetical protein